MFPIETTILRQRTWPALFIGALGIAVLFIPGNQKQIVPLFIAVGFIVLSIALYFLISKSQIIVEDSGITQKTVFKTITIP